MPAAWHNELSKKPAVPDFLLSETAGRKLEGAINPAYWTVSTAVPVGRLSEPSFVEAVMARSL